MVRRFLIILLSFVMITGCQVGNSVIVVSTVTPFSTALPTATNTPTLFPTKTGTPTVSPDVMRYQCLEIVDNSPLEKIPSGVLVFKNEGNTDAFLWNMKADTQIRFPRNEGDRLLSFDVSPDGTRVVYRQANDAGDKTIIAGADGLRIWSQLAKSTSWFDDERLLIRIHPSIGNPYLEFLNPINNERQELHPDFPNIERMFSSVPIDKWRGIKGLPVYDPTLTKVVYPECDSTCEENIAKGIPDFPVVLLDVRTGTILARLKTVDSYGGTPVWLPDGSKFIMSADTLSMESVFARDPYFRAGEFYAIGQDGQINQLTHFTDQYTDVDIYDSYMLSPDGRWAAFWIAAKPSQFDEARLAIMDIWTGDVTNYCLEGAPFMDASRESLLEPIWSPDSTQLLTIDRDPQNDSRRRVILVDIVLNFAEVIAENVEPVGWMVNP